MRQFDVPKMLEQLKRVYVERVVRNGFEDKSLYNDELMKLNDLELQEFDDLKKIIGQTKAMPKTNQVDINNQGLTDEQYEELEDLEKKSKKKSKDKQPLTEEEKKRLEELKKKKNNREAAISILRGISIRMPLLIYGAELSDESQDITIDNFASPLTRNRGGVHAQGCYQTEVQQHQEILRPGDILCGRQAHPCHGSCRRQTERGRTHRTYNGYIQHIPQS